MPVRAMPGISMESFRFAKAIVGLRGVSLLEPEALDNLRRPKILSPANFDASLEKTSLSLLLSSSMVEVVSHSNA